MICSYKQGANPPSGHLHHPAFGIGGRSAAVLFAWLFLLVDLLRVPVRPLSSFSAPATPRSPARSRALALGRAPPRRRRGISLDFSAQRPPPPAPPHAVISRRSEKEPVPTPRVFASHPAPNVSSDQPASAIGPRALCQKRPETAIWAWKSTGG